MHAADFLTIEGITLVIELIELLISCAGVVIGLLELVRWAKGRKLDKPKNLKDGHVQFTVDGDSFKAPHKVVRLYQNKKVRESLDKLIAKTLEREGIDKFTATDNNGNREVVEKKDAQYFGYGSMKEDTLVDETRTRASFSIVSLRFTEEHRWKLNDGDKTIAVTIKDQDFLDRVARNDIRFSKGDLLVCEVKTQQFRDDSKPKTVHTVERVVEHQKASLQLPPVFCSQRSLLVVKHQKASLQLPPVFCSQRSLLVVKHQKASLQLPFERRISRNIPVVKHQKASLQLPMEFERAEGNEGDDAS